MQKIKDLFRMLIRMHLYRNEVKRVMNDWTTNGYKEDVEKISAYIKHVSPRNMTLLKAELQDRLQKAKLTDPTTGAIFTEKV